MAQVWLLGLFLCIFACKCSDAAVPSFRAVGCYKDKNGDRALPKQIASYRGKIDWKDTTKTIEFCAQAAVDQGFAYFAVQFYGECWAGNNPDYDKHGSSDNCWESVGKEWTNFVFRFSGK